MGSSRRCWSRNELLAAFNLYCRTPFGRLHRHNPDVIQLAQRLGRTPSAVAMKLCNFASLDPIQRKRKIRGLRNVSAADRRIFEEFNENWERLARESELAMERLGVRIAEPAPEGRVDCRETGVTQTEVTRKIPARRAQALFRATVLASYDFACAMSGINVPQLLEACHIVPWAAATARRIDPRNGITLSALHHRAFDAGLLTVDEELRIVVSSVLKKRRGSRVYRSAILELDGQRIRLPSRYAPDPEALEYHRTKVFIP